MLCNVVNHVPDPNHHVGKGGKRGSEPRERRRVTWYTTLTTPLTTSDNVVNGVQNPVDHVRNVVHHVVGCGRPRSGRGTNTIYRPSPIQMKINRVLSESTIPINCVSKKKRLSENYFSDSLLTILEPMKNEYQYCKNKLKLIATLSLSATMPNNFLGDFKAKSLILIFNIPFTFNFF